MSDPLFNPWADYAELTQLETRVARLKRTYNQPLVTRSIYGNQAWNQHLVDTLKAYTYPRPDVSLPRDEGWLDAGTFENNTITAQEIADLINEHGRIPETHFIRWTVSSFQSLGLIPPARNVGTSLNPSLRLPGQRDDGTWSDWHTGDLYRLLYQLTDKLTHLITEGDDLANSGGTTVTGEGWYYSTLAEAKAAAISAAVVNDGGDYRHMSYILYSGSSLGWSASFSRAQTIASPLRLLAGITGKLWSDTDRSALLGVTYIYRRGVTGIGAGATITPSSMGSTPAQGVPSDHDTWQAFPADHTLPLDPASPVPDAILIDRSNPPASPGEWPTASGERIGYTINRRSYHLTEWDPEWEPDAD